MYRILVFVLVAGVNGQFKCPQGTGFFPDLEECDLYYICSKGKYEERLCPDGLVFDDTDPNKERCDIPQNIDCGDRTVLQEAKPSEGCPRANGYFRHPDPAKCDKFYNCDEGKHKELSCPPGLVFDEVKAICVWPASSKRQNCFKEKKEILDDGFQCPKEDVMGQNGRKIPHPTYAHPDDCQKFYICRNGVSPQKGSCSRGYVYNEETFTCDDPKNVPGCENYYSEKKN